MYVWFDALTNYLSAMNSPDLWPADCHLIGKDIVWFHAVIWIGILLSAGLELPNKLAVHGFINDKDGKKMSKSLGNTVDPTYLLDRYHVDSIRLFFIYQIGRFGDDIKFSEDELKILHDAELCDNIGNLVNRLLILSSGVIPDCNAEPLFNISSVVEIIRIYMENFEFQETARLILGLFKNINNYLGTEKPWLANSENPARVIKSCLEGVYILANMIYPIIPETSQRILNSFNHERKLIQELTWSNLDSSVKMSGNFDFTKLNPKKKSRKKIHT